MTDTDLTLLTKRVASRLPDVRGLVIVADPGPVRTTLAASYTLAGEPRTTTADVFTGADVSACVHVLTRAIYEATETRRLTEAVLTEDTSVVLNGHALRIAEQQRVVRAEARVDGVGYTAADAERDLGLVAEALCKSAGYDDASAKAFVDDAIDLLGRLRLTAFGAPLSSEGGRYLAAQANGHAQREPAVAPNGSRDVPDASEAGETAPSVVEAPARRSILSHAEDPRVAAIIRESIDQQIVEIERAYPGPNGGLLSLEDAENLARRGLPPSHYAKTDGGDR